jgi:hypothetical protein
MRVTPSGSLAARRLAPILVVAVVLTARAAAAFVDVTGAWDVTWGPPGGERVCVLTQAAPNLTIDCEQIFDGPLGPLGPFTLHGTIDADTGAFSWSTPSNPEFGCPDSILTGMVDAGATSFEGHAAFWGFNPSFGGCFAYQSDLTAVRSACGNGALDAGEYCDDGNNVGGDCTCGKFCDDAEGTACDDGVFCNGPDQCQSGACAVHAGDPCHATPCADHCNEDTNDCFEPAGTQECGPCQACDGQGACAPALAAAPCRQSTNPVRSSLALTRKGGGKDQLKWKWRAGEATDPSELGDPTTTDDYTLCVFGAADTSPTEVLFAQAHRNGVGCSGCWKRLGNPPGSKGAKYKSGGPIRALIAKPGPIAKSSISLAAGGPSLALPSGPIALPVRVQLQSSNGGCWEGTFSAPSVNDGTRFKAKGG